MSDQIDVNQLSNALQQKVDLPSGKSQADIDYVVEWKAPTSSDPTWYRLYKSGWVEQGSNNPVSVGSTVNLSVEMADTNYFVGTMIDSYTGTSGMGANIFKITKTTTTVKIGDHADYQGIKATWEVKGFAAQS